MFQFYYRLKLIEFLAALRLESCYTRHGNPRHGISGLPGTGLIHYSDLLFRKGALLLCLLVALIIQPVRAYQDPPAGFSSIEVSSDWNEAVGLTFSKDGSKMFVWERGGKVWVVENGQKQLLLDISEEVGSWHDHGLLGFALHPQFETNGYFYLHYLVDRHYLINYGTAAYNPASNDYYSATIGRLTRYTATKTTGGYSVSPASRKIMIGETKTTGIPSLERSHVTGSIVFGTDGTLLIATGDGANGAGTDMGSDEGTYYEQALADGIITDKENVGAFRAQLLDCLNGKILRIDPVTGAGISSNPFYDPAKPNATRSKVWAMGLRNPFRMSLKPGTGSHNPDEGKPGTLYLGDVGYITWEEINVVSKPGQNFGWPIFEGLTPHEPFANTPTPNYYAPNPLYGSGGCNQQFFDFQDLLQQVTASGTATFTNPCNPAQGIPASIPTFIHSRPIIDWRHGSGPARTGIFTGETAAVVNIGAAGSPVSGPQFGGSSSTGGVFYTGTDFPPEYRNTYFHGDYSGGWIRNISLDASDKPTAVRDFIDHDAIVVAMATHPTETGLYYINFGSEIRKVVHSANRQPAAVATADKTYGPGPLTVQFTGSASTDPEGKPLTYEWNFGDGTTSTLANPSRIFTAATGAPAKYAVSLKVTDDQGITDEATLVISVNNTPPQVTITSPASDYLYSMNEETTLPLRATVTDPEHNSSQLSYQWQTTLHHETHSHPEPIDTDPETTTRIEPLGCGAETYYYQITLTVTDAAGLSTKKEVKIYPDCNSFVENASHFAVAPANGQVKLTWDNPVGAFDEVIIVAKASSAISASPNGDGTAYTANLSFMGPGTPFDGGKVVYKGKVSPQTVTNLTNNITYFFKIFTRKGSSWSKGVQVAAVPLTPIIREYWANVPGATVAAIPVNTPPTSISELTLLEGPTSAAENYGVRIRGYVHPPATGDYLFWIAGDDQGELWLSTDESPANKRRIAFFSDWTNSREWTKFASQQSVLIPLQAGQKYYIEVLHKEDTGTDHLAVGWQLPDGILERPIRGSHLSPFVITGNQPPFVTLTGPANGATFTAPASITLEATASDNDGTISKVEFYQGNTKLGEDLTSPYTYSWNNVAAGSYTLTAKAADNAANSTTSTAVTINVGSSTGSQFYRALNLNGNGLSIDGTTWEASSSAANFSYVTDGGSFTDESVPLIPATDVNRTAMIQSSIWGSNVNLTIGAVPSGTYDIWLYVWEDNLSATYSLSLEGTLVLANFSSGSAGSWSKSGPYRVIINDGVLNVATNGGHANLSGIEMWKVAASGNTPPTVANAIPDQNATIGTTFSFTFASNTFIDADGDALTYSATLADNSALPAWLGFNAASRTFSGTPPTGSPASLTVKVTVSDGKGGMVADSFILSIAPEGTTTTALYRVNAGGGAFAASGSRSFSVDGNFSGGSTYSTGGEVANTVDDALYQSERYGAFSYNLPVSSGTYNVVLHFNELYWGNIGGGGAGSRRFHVNIEGQRKLTDYDVFAIAGGAMRAVTENFTVTVTDGTLNIAFVNGSADQPKISAIEVLSTGPDTQAPTASLSPSNGATAVAITESLVLTFNEAVQRGTGTITITQSSTTQTFNVATATAISFSADSKTVTINPADFPNATAIAVSIPAGAFKDLAGNNFSGTSGTTPWSFTTAAPTDTQAPSLTTRTPAHNATSIAITENLVLTFDEVVQAGSGNISITDGITTQSIPVTDASRVSFSADKKAVAVNPL